MVRSRKTVKTLLPKKIEDHLAGGDFEAIEEIWLARLEEADRVRDVPYFATIARALSKAGAAETARFLLELLDEHLADAGHWPERLELLRRSGALLAEPADLHPMILETLEEIHGDQPSYQQMLEKVGLLRAVEDLPKSWKKVERLRGLLVFDVGSIVHMEGKGAGKVLEVNMALESFKVEFENDLELRVGFGGAAKLLAPLEPDHVLYRKMMDPQSLIQLRDRKPAELLRLVLESYDQPRTGAEIKRTLSGIVPEKKWYRWWSAARKHPQVVAAPGGRRAYTWAASHEDAHDAIWDSFEDGDARTRMAMLRRDAGRDEELKRRMSASLADAADLVVDEDPGLACEIWFALERDGELPDDPPWSPELLLSELEDPRALLRGIQDRGWRERAYEMARQGRTDWPALFSELMWQEEDRRSLDLLSRRILEDSETRFSSFLDQLLSQPRKNPAAFTWFAEAACERPEWLQRNPIRLLKQLFWAFSNENFAPFRATRLMPLLESGHTVPRLLALLDEKQAAEAYAAIEKASALQTYQKRPLLNAILLRYPELRQEDEAPLYATRDMIEAKRLELKNLTEVEIPANRRAIEEARELGDLSENFEYKSARQRHEYLAARAASLNRDLSRVRPIDPALVKGNEVVIGCRIELVSDDGTKRPVGILGPWESKPEKDVFSNESDLAQSLLGSKVGDEVQIGENEYRVEAIEPYA